MVEGGALEMSEDEFIDALEFAHRGIRELVGIQAELVGPLAKPKMEYTPPALDQGLVARVNELAARRVTQALNLPSKEERNQALVALRENVTSEVSEPFESEIEDYEGQVARVIDQIEYETLRAQIIWRKRSEWTAEGLRRFDRSVVRSGYFHAHTVRPSSRAEVHRRWPWSRSAPAATSSALTRSMSCRRRPSRSCCTTTSHLSP